MEKNLDTTESTPLPENIGRYQVKKLIGKGGMGEVYLCFDPTTERDVALKRIRPEMHAIPLIRQRFMKEALIAAQLTHPAILAVYSIEETNDDLFYVMPYIQGKTLKMLLAEIRKSKDSTLYLVRDFLTVCHAVEYAHTKGVLHRDLKPENILIGPFNEVMIYDFGLAEYADMTDYSLDEAPVFKTHPDLTRVGKIVGTITYMAPERILEKLDTIQSDIYSLGVILYQILTLKHPFKRGSVKQFKQQIHLEKIPDPVDIAPMREVPPLLAKIAMKCLAFRKEDRYNHLKDLIKDLELYFEGKADWVFASRLDPKQGADWELQETIVLKQSRDWAIYMLSSTLFPGNVRLQAELTFLKGGEGIGFLLGVAHKMEQKGLDSGLTVWLQPGEVRLLRAGIVLKTIPTDLIRFDEPIEVEIEKLYESLSLKIQKKTLFTFPIFLPVTGAHVGLVYKDLQYRLKNFSVYVGSYNARIGCLTIPDTFFASELYEKALEEYQRITHSFERRSEGLIATFRSGLTLLELNRTEEAFTAFERLHKTQKGVLEWLGKGLAYRKLHEVTEEAKCYEIALNLFKNDPKLILIEEEILFRLEQSKEEGRLGPYLFALIAIRYQLISADHPSILELKSPLECFPALGDLSTEALFALYLMKNKVLETLEVSLAIEFLEHINEPGYPLVTNVICELLKVKEKHSPSTIQKLCHELKKKKKTIPLHQYLPLELAILELLQKSNGSFPC
ncbi:MAG: protein kinase domain-containing protein [Chlamydiia bacterium]